MNSKIDNPARRKKKWLAVGRLEEFPKIFQITKTLQENVIFRRQKKIGSKFQKMEKTSARSKFFLFFENSYRDAIFYSWNSRRKWEFWYGIICSLNWTTEQIGQLEKKFHFKNLYSKWKPRKLSLIHISEPTRPY